MHVAARSVALCIVAAGAVGCTTLAPPLEQEPFSYPANWPELAYGPGKYDCPELTGSYSNAWFATTAEASAPSPLLSELFTLLAANQPLDGTQLWDPVPEADTVRISRDPAHVGLDFLGDNGRKDSLQFADPRAVRATAHGGARHLPTHGKRYGCSHERLQFEASPTWLRGNPFPDRYLPDKVCPATAQAVGTFRYVPTGKTGKPLTPRTAGQDLAGAAVEVALELVLSALASDLQCSMQTDIRQMNLYLGRAADGSLVVLARIHPGMGLRSRDYWYRYAPVSVTEPD